MKRNTIIASLLFVSFAIAGCSQPSEIKHAIPKDGSIVSLKQLTKGYTDTNIYEMYYKSAGVNVDSFIEVPVKPGKYPLMVYCHGGDPFPQKSRFEDDSIYFTWKILTEHAGNAVYIYPNYRGYGKSDGTIPGFEGIVTDIENAIRAAQSFKGTQITSVYLYGQSLGGGAVLQVASERKDVKAVIADSPYLGAGISDKWFEKIGKPKKITLEYIYNTSRALYGTNYSSAAYQANSPITHMAAIHAPVLVMQGTADPKVIWQSVQEFVDNMKKEGKVINLILVQDGQHVLLRTSGQSYNAAIDWFMKYGFPEVAFNN